MNRPDSLSAITLTKAFEAFLESTSFARRTRESYADDLAPLLTQYGQADIAVLTTEIIQAYLAHQESLAPTTYNRRLAALRSFLGFLRAQGWQTDTLLAGVERKPEQKRVARALDAQRVEAVLRQICESHWWLSVVFRSVNTRPPISSEVASKLGQTSTDFKVKPRKSA